MSQDSRKHYAWLLLAWLAGLTAWRVLSAMHAHVELYGDEAQYWTWSLHPDWGYYSKPPVVAWAIWLGTRLFGDGELGVRSMSFVMYPLTAWTIFLLTRRLFRPNLPDVGGPGRSWLPSANTTGPDPDAAAFWSALLFATLPLTSLGSMLITTDAPLLLAWALSAYFAVAALETGRWRDWLLLGAALGFGLMSKYSMAFFGLGLVSYALFSRERWPLFVNPRPYAAAVLALLMVAPNILWNAENHFVSFHHTAEISELDRSLFHPKALLDFVLGQFLVFGPVSFGWLVAVAVRPRQWFDDDRFRFVAALTLAPLAAFLVLSLLSRAFINWAAFVYVSGATLVAAALLLHGRRTWLKAAIVVNLALGVVAYNFHDIARLLDVQLTRKTDPYGRVTGFRALGEEVGKRLAEHPGVHFLTDERMLYALIRYYGRPHSEDGKYLNLSGRLDNHYALTADVAAQPKGEYLLVTQHMTEAQVRGLFAEALPQPDIRFKLYPDFAPTYKVWLVRDYLKKS